MNEAPDVLLDRYDTMMARVTDKIECAPDPGTSPSHDRWMLSQLRQPMGIFKASRWLGFVQRGIIERGLTSVQAERDFTRPLFTALPVQEDLETRLERALSLLARTRHEAGDKISPATSAEIDAALAS